MRRNMSQTRSIGRSKLRMLAMMMAIVIAITAIPAFAAAAPSPAITVTGQNGATSVFMGTTLQMNSDSATPVTWSVQDLQAGVPQASNNNATINETTGLLSAVSMGTVRVTATSADATGFLDISINLYIPPVFPPVTPPILPPTTTPTTVGALTSTLSLQGGSLVTLGKTKVIGLSGANTFLATAGQATAQTAPATGTSASVLSETYVYDLSFNPFVPAEVGQAVSIIEVNGDGVIVGFGTLTLDSEGLIGTNPPPAQFLDETSARIAINEYWNSYYFVSDPDGESLYMSGLTSSDTSIFTVTDYYYYGYMNGISAGTATLSFYLADATGDRILYEVNVVVGLESPSLYEEDMPFTNKPYTFHFNPNALWQENITSVELNGNALSANDYTLYEDSIVLRPQVLAPGDNRIFIRSAGYATSTRQFQLHSSEQSFFLSPVNTEVRNGSLAATLKALYNYDNESYWEEATVVFQLMNGNTPVSTISYTMDEIDSYQSFRAEFNLADAATNQAYAIRAFLITGDNANGEQLGYNLGTTLTQEQFDEMYLEW